MFLVDILCINLSGGIVGLLRFDGVIICFFDINIWLFDEDNIEFEFIGVFDIEVIFIELEKEFVVIFVVIVDFGILEGIYFCVLDCFEGFWLDWDDNEDIVEWMVNYVLDCVFNLCVFFLE